ncbi:hypothetical protein D3C72_1484270 [compost metagenome]
MAYSRYWERRRAHRGRDDGFDAELRTLAVLFVSETVRTEWGPPEAMRLTGGSAERAINPFTMPVHSWVREHS